MDAGYRIHEVSRTVDCLVLVPSSNEPVFCMLPIHPPYSTAGYDVPLNDGYKGGTVTLGDQLHKEVASSRVTAPNTHCGGTGHVRPFVVGFALATTVLSMVTIRPGPPS